MPRARDFERGDSETSKARWRWRRSALAMTLTAWLTVIITGVQTYLNRRATEESAYAHIIDTSQVIERAVARFFAENRTLSRAIAHELPLEQSPGSSPCPARCEEVLIELKKRYVELFPRIEILVMDPQAQVVAATEPDMRNRLARLDELAEHFRSRRDAMALVRHTKNTLNEHSLLFSRAQRTATGELLAVVVYTVPMTPLSELLVVPELGPGRAVTLADSTGVLLARDPSPLLVHVGQYMKQFLDESQPGRGVGSFRAVSKIDRVDRLWIKRDIAFSWAPGGLVLYVGVSVDDYMADWRRATLLSSFTCIMLLVGWVWSVFIFRRHAYASARLMATMGMTRKVMESTPVPVVVVSEGEGRVVMSNGAMLNLFGALAAAGEPVRRMFRDETLFDRLREHEDVAPAVAELASRRGLIHAELHRTDLGDLGGAEGRCWLLVLIDVSERLKREQHLQLEATTDALTGLANRRHFVVTAEQKIAKARVDRLPLSVLAIDLDHFKRINDEHGHDVGDLVLTAAARIFKGLLRDSDFPARVGGEEFAVLLPRADRRGAEMVAERIRVALAATPIVLPNDRVVMMTVSIGVSLWQADDTDIQAALKRADQALYVAKNKGRNRVEFGGEEVAGAA